MKWWTGVERNTTGKMNANTRNADVYFVVPRCLPSCFPFESPSGTIASPGLGSKFCAVASTNARTALFKKLLRRVARGRVVCHESK